MNNTPTSFGFFGAAAGAAIFQLIRDIGPLSRADLGRQTGLSRSTVSQHVERLLRLGIVLEEPDARYSAASKRKQLVFNEQCGYVVAIDLGVTSVDLALCNLGAEIIEYRELDIAVALGPKQVMNSLTEAIDDLLVSNQVQKDTLLGMGMGIPGPVEFLTGTPIYPPIMPGWHEYPIKQVLEKRYGCVVYVDNDVNMMAVGELKYGAGLNIDDQLFVKVGSGIGAGLILGGQLYRGSQGSAGDIGHIAVKNNEELCSCGNRGCLEAMASGRALARIATKLAQEGRSHRLQQVLLERGEITAKDVAQVAHEGDSLCMSLVRDTGEAIGAVLAGMINFVNPSLIIVGGGVAGMGDRLIATIKETIYRKSTPLATSSLEVCLAKLGNEAGVIGAAALVADEVFSMERVTEMVNREGLI